VAFDRLTETDLPPDVFAIVMATGIVSVAARGHAYPRIGEPLAALATVVFVLLAAGLVVRVAARPGSAIGEIRDPDVALRMFTSVAACTVLGVRFIGEPAVVALLGILALLGWLILAPLAIADVRSRPRTDLRDHAHGAWLLPSVATAGLATTAADLAMDDRSAALLDTAAVAWVVGIGVYCAVTWLIAWRALAAPFQPDAVTPDSWILMGALAIATLAGDHLLAAADALSGFRWLADAVRPVTLVTWILASLWIPILLYAEVWRIDQRPGSLRYTRVWWSAVFPVGMYSAATEATSQQLHMPSLATISLVMFWIAFAVWLVVALGWVHGALAGRSPSSSQ
jgi:tellurite resistance protein TehA-like permease